MQQHPSASRRARSPKGLLAPANGFSFLGPALGTDQGVGRDHGDAQIDCGRDVGPTTANRGRASMTETVQDLVTLETAGPIRILTLNRPAVSNAFNDALKLAFVARLRELVRDQDARAVVLTGAGHTFSSGGDISNFAHRYEFPNRFYWMREARLLADELLRCHLPVVAAASGSPPPRPSPWAWPTGQCPRPTC